MERGAPEAFGFEAAGSLPPIGRARRFECEAGELLVSSADDAPLAARLLALGKAGLGGFLAGGSYEVTEDDTRVWLVRRCAASTPTLADLLRKKDGGLAWEEAVRVARGIARALAAAEAEGLFGGALSPSAILVDGAEVTWTAEDLVRAMFGDGARASRTEPSASMRWLPPEQARGAPFDNAANRYVLGLVLYRMIAGEHAFGTKGLRLGFDEQATRGAPPFSDAIARALPLGLQSFCLRLLHPKPEERPQSAKAVLERLETLGRDGAASPEILSDEPSQASVSVPDGRKLDADRPDRERREPVERTVEPADEPVPPVRRSPPSRLEPRLVRNVVIMLVAATSVALGAGLLALVDGEPAAPAVSVAARPVLDAATTRADDCASCHSRQVGEWRRSVMAHSARSPLFLALEMLIEEQVGRETGCEHGAGILRQADPTTACRDRASGVSVTGSGGELWCVNCHAPSENLGRAMPAWDGQALASRSRLPLSDLLPDSTMDGIGCAFCHQVHGPVGPGSQPSRGDYQGNPFWTGTRTGQRFEMRPEDDRGLLGIGNSGYALDPTELLVLDRSAASAGGVHTRPGDGARAYLRSSEFCGACHDVRLFGADGLRREPFKRLRNAYSEWADWSLRERAAGRIPATCQDCHMSRYPGVCVPGDPEVNAASNTAASDSAASHSALARACPEGTHFEPRPPGDYPDALVAVSSTGADRASTHYLSGVDVPLSDGLAPELIDDATTDVHGIPLGARQRRDLLLGRTFRFELGRAARVGGVARIPLTLENIGAGHRVPAGFSQEREIWVHLLVTDARGATVYEVGRVDRDDEDLRDKVFLRVNTSDASRDALGRPLGLFGADIADGPDVPQWSPPAELGGTEFRGRGLINLQNGFLRCVTCVGRIDFDGRCQPGPGGGRTRADRFADGAFDAETGVCTSNLVGQNAFFETYFPVGSLDARQGVLRGPDAIIDTRSAPPGVPIRYTYELPLDARVVGPLRVEARLMFRAFPPFLIRAFADYERAQARAGLRPGGPLVTDAMLARLDRVEIARVTAVIE